MHILKLSRGHRNIFAAAVSMYENVTTIMRTCELAGLPMIGGARDFNNLIIILFCWQDMRIRVTAGFSGEVSARVVILGKRARALPWVSYVDCLLRLVLIYDLGDVVISGVLFYEPRIRSRCGLSDGWRGALSRCLVLIAVVLIFIQFIQFIQTAPFVPSVSLLLHMHAPKTHLIDI